VDPITREGIYFAIASGAWCAGALIDSNSRAAPAAAYTNRVRDEAGSELARAARFRDRFFRPRFVAAMLIALQRSEAIRRVMADLVAGEQSYRTLRRRLLGTLEFGIAARALLRR
jgi:flavin-dependent dehydrogenase